MRRKKGFTLVELLVVIAIIAMLLSILMPSLRAAREQARLVIGKTRQNQLGLANLMYADDINNGVTLNVVGVAANGDVATSVAWDMCSLFADGGKDTYRGLAILFATGILDHSRKSATIFFCPSIPKNNSCSADYVDTSLRPGDDGYGMTSLDRIMFDGWSVSWAIQIMTGCQVRNKWSSGVFPNGPGTQDDLASTPGRWGYNLASETKSSFISDPWPAYHNGKGTAWFLDGHVKTWDGKTLKTRDWYESRYYSTYWATTATNPPRCNQDQILMNYGVCFRWIDGDKGATRKADNPIF